MKKQDGCHVDTVQSDTSQEIDDDSDTVEKPETSKAAEKRESKRLARRFPKWLNM